MQRVEGWLSSRDLFDQGGGDAVVVVAVVGTPAWQDYLLSLNGKVRRYCKQKPCTDISLPSPELPLYSMVCSTAV